MKRHDPATPLPNAQHEAYVQQRAAGKPPTEAGRLLAIKNHEYVERQARVRDRLQFLLREPDEPGVSLEWLVRELKQTAKSARASGQFKNANEALAQLGELYAKHPELRGEAKAPASSCTAATPVQLEERRRAREERLSAVPAEAAGE